ncbi:Flp pilus assembly protein TadG [Sphingomonas sp. UYAg733]
MAGMTRGTSRFSYPGRAALARHAACTRGTAVIEMALALPLLLTFLLGIVAYGNWFLTAHDVQQAANDAARATIAGLTPTERATIAASSVETNMRRSGGLDPRRASVQLEDDGATLVVHVTYDARNNPLLAIKFLPMPSPTIERSAAIRLDNL